MKSSNRPPFRLGMIGFTAAAAFAVVAFAPTARAQSAGTAVGECEYYVSGSCDVACSDISLEASCDVDYSAQCEGKCDVSAELDCSATCTASCEADCKIDPGKFDCQGYCEADCGATCEGICASDVDSVTCQGACEADCSGSCELDCQAAPPKLDCAGSCEASCNGSCAAQAEVSCNVDCQASARADCEAEITGQCTGGCDSDGGVLICNGEAVTYGTYEDALAYAEAEGYVDIGPGRIDAGATVSCSVGGAPASPLSDASIGVLMLALVGLVARRRSR